MSYRRSTSSGIGHLLILGLLLIAAVGGGIVSMSGFMPNYSDGFRSGNLQKASYKGFINKSFEGQLVLKGFKSTNTTNTNSNGVTSQTGTLTNMWYFSARDPAVAQQLKNAAGKNVTLHYKQWFWRPVFEQSTQYTVYKVEVHN